MNVILSNFPGSFDLEVLHGDSRSAVLSATPFLLREAWCLGGNVFHESTLQFCLANLKATIISLLLSDNERSKLTQFTGGQARTSGNIASYLPTAAQLLSTSL